MNALSGKVAVVTGASKGIGAEIARRFAAAGAAVVVNYASSRADAERVVGEIVRAGGSAIAVQADVSRGDDVRRLFAEAKTAFGQLDVLVNNAGVYRFEPLEAVTEAEYRRQFDLNVLGTILAALEAARHFGPHGGSIVNVSSIASVNQMPNSVVYSATKAAVDSITRVLAIELAPRNIRVNAVAPGATATEGLAAIGGVGTDFEKTLVAGIPMGRLGQPAEIANVALFLASNDASWLTGERITASGGQR
ncbi:MAG TPA: glucose 1-dehydrogenase [Dokdonella sp.]|nr:glucose 1-dehydrogenase [Dokdonella sp.]